MAEETPETVSPTVLKALTEILETNKEILKLFEVVEERRRQHGESLPGAICETKQVKDQRASNELQNVQSEVIANLTPNNEDHMTKESTNVKQVVVRNVELSVDNTLDSIVDADQITKKERGKSAKADVTSDTQLVNDLEKKNEKASSTGGDTVVTNQSLLTDEQNKFARCLKSRKSVPPERDNRFQTAIDNEEIRSADSPSNALDRIVDADQITKKERGKSAKADVTSDTQLDNDLEKKNEKASSARGDTVDTNQSLLTDEQKKFARRLKSRKSVPPERDNRFQTAIDNGEIRSADSPSNTVSDTAQKESTDTVTSERNETVSEEQSKLYEAVSSDTGKGEVNENTIIDGTDESKEVINQGDDDEEILKQLEYLENIPHIEPEEKERVIIDIEKWDEYANEEVAKGRLAKEMHLKGSDTIFCLDISMSMKGKPLQQAKAFIHNYIEDLQSTEVTDETYEHVALVTFGHETKVQHHLSYEYFQLLTKLAHVKAEGPSPLFAGLKMCWAVLQGAAGIVPASTDNQFHPKVYLLSDGSVTPSSFVAGPDSCNEEDKKQEQDQVMNYCACLYREFHLVINVVSVGDELTDLQEAITKTTKGELITSGSWIFTAQTYENDLTVGDKEHDDDQRSVEDKYEEGNVQPASSLEYATQTSDSNNESDESEFNEAIANSLVKNFPPLGARVKRKGEELFGTVTKCYADAVTVTWDKERRNGPHTEDFLEPGSIEIVNRPRCLLKDELIAIGCRVKRGPDWRSDYGYQDGSPGSKGTVCKVKDTGLVKVVWKNGDKYYYRFGLDEKFDLEVLEAERPIRTETLSKNKNDRIAHKNVHVKGIENHMGMPESSQNSEICSGATSSQSFTWRWKDSVGSWKTYPDDLNTLIEANYCDNPNGLFFFSHFGTKYKIMFKRMAKLDVGTGEKYPVSRRQL